MAIEMDLTVNDKGSATVTAAARRMNDQLSTTERSARAVSMAFEGVRTRILSVTSGLFSFNSIIGVLGGATGLTFVTKKLLEMAKETGDANFTNSLGIINREWGGFADKIGQYVANSPAVNQGLKDLAKKVGEWGTALTENKVVIDDWATFAVSAVGKVGDAMVSAIKTIGDFTRAAPIGTMKEENVIPTLLDRLTGMNGGFEAVQGYFGPEAQKTANQTDFQSVPTSQKNAVVNMYMNERMNTHQVGQEVLDVLERIGFRDSSGDEGMTFNWR